VDAMVSAMNIIGSDKSLQDHWGKRLVALIIDYAIFQVISWVAFWLLFIPWWGNWWGPAAFGWTVFQPGFAGIMLFIYSFAMESSSSGATIGKKVMNLRVIPISGNMDVGKAVMRNISKIHGLFLVLDWLVGFVSEGDPKQKWLDRVAGTTVVITTTLTEEQQHTYQTQQAKVAPPPQEQYATRHEAAYQYPPAPAKAEPKPAAGQKTAAQKSANEMLCGSCGGRLTETGAGRLKCIRCGKIQ
jgi:uncharacterized RDD family membrane protein YckC